MLSQFYLFLIPILVAVVYLAIKFFMHRKEIEKLSTNAFINVDDKVNNIEEAKEKVFDSIDKVKAGLYRTMLFVFHWLLHFFVIFLKVASETVDYSYSKSRDFFLKTATKEKGAVSTFWHHLKEYKKEKEEENKE